ncbi:MAG TPA: AMP-binding protein, partial [Thermoanaerobaculia bacterium]|nr:AMP-binding protein [Thermoanaerobaculia bacterium]
HERPSVFCGVPTLFSAILAHPDVVAGKVDFRSVKGAFSGAAALLAETKKRFEDITGGRIIEAYSLTEATLAACINPYRGVNKIGSVGMPLPDVDVRIVDGDSGTRELAAGQVGEIVIRAPQLMQRYWNNPEETEMVLHRDADGSPALFTGDLGYLDEDGYLFIVDRKKDLIKTSGNQVWPREIEEVIATHPMVVDVGVAGVPDPRRGEAVMAWLVVRGNGSISLGELRDFCHDKLAPYKIPSRIEIRKELPKTMVGKVLRRSLVADEKAHMAEA